MLPIAGGVGIGLVYGWYVGSFEGRFNGFEVTIPAIIAAGMAISLMALWLSGVFGLVGFIVSTACALSIHVIWRRSLRRRFGSTTGS